MIVNAGKSPKGFCPENGFQKRQNIRGTAMFLRRRVFCPETWLSKTQALKWKTATEPRTDGRGSSPVWSHDCARDSATVGGLNDVWSLGRETICFSFFVVVVVYSLAVVAPRRASRSEQILKKGKKNKNRTPSRAAAT